MSRPKSLGSYAPLSTSYYRDDAVLEAGEKAELLFVRGLAYCAEATSDGFITERQLAVVVAPGMRDATNRAARLVEVGLWERAPGGYVIRGWLKWNRSASDIGRALKKDRERKAGTSPSTRHKVYDRDGNACRYCRSADDLCLDHIKPLALGGGHEDDNLQTLCQPCNWKKGQRDASGMSVEQARESFSISHGIPVGTEQEPLQESRPRARGRTPEALHNTTQHNTQPAEDGSAAAAGETLGQRGNRLTKAYTDVVKLSNFPAVAGVVRKAINAGHDDPAISDALGRLAAEGRSVTTDSLRVELEGMPASRYAKPEQKAPGFWEASA